MLKSEPLAFCGIKKAANAADFVYFVAGTGLEPATFGLWAQRATTAPPRDFLGLQIYNIILTLQDINLKFINLAGICLFSKIK